MKHIKKMQYIGIACIFSILLTIPALAISPDSFSLTDSDDWMEIQQLSPDICGWVNSLIEDNHDNVPFVTPEQLDFSKAYRIDVDSTIFKQDISTEEQLTTFLNQADSYIWELPVSSGNKTYVLTLEIGQPLNPEANLTEEEQQLIQSQEGKWSISSITADGDQTYLTSQIQDITTANHVRYDDIFYITDTDSHCTFAVLSNNNQLTSAVVLKGMLSVTDQRTRAAKTITFDPDTIYSFEEVRQVLALAEPNVQPGTVGGGTLIIHGEQSKLPATPIVMIIICAGALTLIYMIRKHTANH